MFDRILPTYSGVFTDAEHGMSGKLVLMDTAQRYEVSTRPIPVIMGGTAALKWFADELGWAFVYDRLTSLYGRLWDDLHSIEGVHLLSQRDQSGLMTFTIDGVEPVDIVPQLREHNIFSRTVIVTKPNGVRISIGIWNRESDIERIAEVVASIG